MVDQDDYITSVKVYYEKLSGPETEIITALVFKTFKGKTSQPFGISSPDISLLEGGKITGFYGSSGDVLHSIGAYMSLSSTPMLRGKWIKVHSIIQISLVPHSFFGLLRLKISYYIRFGSALNNKW